MFNTVSRCLFTCPKQVVPANRPVKTSSRVSISSSSSSRRYCSKPQKNRIWVLGDNLEGQIGIDNPHCEYPTELHGYPEIKKVGAGELHSVMIDNEGFAWTFGASAFAQTGQGIDVDILPPQRLDLPHKIVDVSAGKGHTLLLADDGQVYSFGDGESYQLGYSQNGCNPVPTLISALKGVNVKQISCGSLHNVVLDDCGRAYSWGSGHYGQHGHGIPDNFGEPTLIQALADEPIELLSTGLYHTVVVTKSQKVLAFGFNKNGSIGQPVKKPHYFLRPTEVTGTELSSVDEKWIHLTGGMSHNILSSNKGRTLSWGSNVGNATGHEAKTEIATVLPSLDGVVFKTLGAGVFHNMGYDTSGKVWIWGQGTDYQLGVGRKMVFTPRVLEEHPFSDQEIIQIDGGWAHTLILTTPKREISNLKQ